MLRGWPRVPEGILEGTAPPGVARILAAPPREPSCLLGESTEEGVGHGACEALLTWPSLVQLLSAGVKAGAAKPSPSVWVLLSFRCP